MIWETLDSLDQVHTFYVSTFNEGDWMCGFPDAPCGWGLAGGGYNFLFFRKSNSKVSGIMFVTAPSGVTRIQLVM
jgi:hypothetical protein